MPDYTGDQSAMSETAIFPVYKNDKFKPHIDKAKYDEMYAASISHGPKGEEFWLKMAKEHLTFFHPPSKAGRGALEHGDIRFFEDATINTSVNCIDRHHQDSNAIIWERDDGSHENITYAQLLRQVCQLANAMKELGIRKGDVVAVYLPMIPTVAVAMLACARIGAVHTVIFGGFSAEAIKDRVQDGKCKLLITADEGVRGGKIVNIKKIANEAADQCPSLQHILVYKRTGNTVPSHRLDLHWEDIVLEQAAYCSPEVLNAEDPLFLLYTSGSTGKPKGVVHTQAGYMLGAMMTTKYMFDVHNGDVFGCVADVGWITGHSYVVYGPLLNGITTVMFESLPTYPNASRYWKLIQDHGITQFYTSPTAVRVLMRQPEEFLPKSPFEKLRIIGTVGEPINPEAWMWLHEKVGFKRCCIVDTYWQTETGSIVLSPIPGAIATKPGSATLPFFGITPVLLDPVSGTPIDDADQEGALCLYSKWPSMARTLKGAHQRFLRTYLHVYKGYYFTSDGASRDKDGYYWIKGRMDDVLNVSGHRLSTAELESALTSHASCAEAAVIGVHDDITGQAIVAFVCVAHGIDTASQEVAKSLIQTVRGSIGPFASPKHIVLLADLPKTRSGKVLRRVLRKLWSEEELGDISTLADIQVLEGLKGGIAKAKSKS